MIQLDCLDHIVLTVASIERSCTFYAEVLGMRIETSDEGRTALHFDGQKINLHEAGREFEPKALKPTPGSADLCFISTTPLEDVIKHLHQHGVKLELEPSERRGAKGKIRSVYLRDPDANLIEIANDL